MKKIACPDCESEIDYEIGPDESMENVIDTAELLEKIEGEEEVEKMDTLLSLAITGGMKAGFKLSCYIRVPDELYIS